MKLVELKTKGPDGGTYSVFVDPDSVVAICANIGSHNPTTIFLYGGIQIEVASTVREAAGALQESQY